MTNHGKASQIKTYNLKILLYVFLTFLLSLPAIYLLSLLNSVQKSLPSYGFYNVRDLRYAYSDLVSLPINLELARQTPTKSEEILRKTSDLLYVRFSTLRNAAGSHPDPRFDAAIKLAEHLIADIDRLAGSDLNSNSAFFDHIVEKSQSAIQSLNDYVRDIEIETDQMIRAQNDSFVALKSQVVIAFGIMAGLVVTIFYLLVLYRRHGSQINEALLKDSLTGLPNRRAFSEWMEKTGSLAISSHVILLFDVDDFKVVNDRFGHDAGDFLLKTAADHLGYHFSNPGIVARWGGDEFVAAIPMINGSKRATVIWINQCLFSPCNLSFRGDEFVLSLSCGAAFLPDDGKTIEDAMRHADYALYDAKESGKGRLTCYSSIIMERRTHVRRVREGLEIALRDKNLFLVWQPQIDVGNWDVVAGEALLRWRDPESGKIISPGEFIAIAEGSDLIFDIDNYVLEEACRTAALWQKTMARPIRAAINLSPRHFERDDFVESVRSALERHHLPANCLEIELTEGVLLNEGKSVSSNLVALSELGVRLALDDFGTGYSNIAYLTRLKPNMLKIDRSFLKEPNDTLRHEILTSISSLARMIGAETLMEGVETAAELDFLAGTGCRFVQGFYFAKGMPLQEFMAWKDNFDDESDSRTLRQTA